MDDHIFTPYVYQAGWAEDDIYRQYLSISMLLIIGGYATYLTPATLSYYFIYDHDLMKHPLFLKGQIRKEITCGGISVPIMAILSSVIFLVEVRGYSRMYENVSDNQFGWLGVIFDMTAFTLFAEIFAYWTHRGLHHKLVYKHLHKMHHMFKISTPFASHAFHPLDGFLQSLCFHANVMFFHLHKQGFLIMFTVVNLWTVSIHESNYKVPNVLKSLVNGSAHHMEHHLHYNYNYGQFFTFSDKLFGSFRHPSAYEGKGPTFDVKSLQIENNNVKKK